MEFKLPKRNDISNKGTYGKVVNVAGSRYMRGAAFLSSASALKIGCGYCTLVSCDEVIDSIGNNLSSLVFAPYCHMEKIIKSANVLSIGCGLGNDDFAEEIFKKAIKYAKDIPVIIDADGLNILGKNKVDLSAKTILTPHPKEASRLLSVEMKLILQNPEYYAKLITEKYNCVTVLKLHNTVVCSKGFDIFINKTGNSALAKAGSGDVLCGIISGLVAQGMEMFEAAKLAVYIHGLCGELASQDLSEYGVMANDLIDYIPKVIKKFDLI